MVEEKAGPHILVIEDEPGIADTITYALSTEGFHPIWCSTGREGTAVLAKEEIALIILDVGLPDVNGFELCKEIRRTSSIPIIFLTVRADEIDRVVGLEIGGDDYMVKPFSPRELTARVKAIMRRSAREEDPAERAIEKKSPHFTVDEERFLISYRGRPLELSRYEFRILKILTRRPGRIYSREQLLELAWEEPESILDRTVDAHIKAIRRKLREIKPDVDPIKTHRGFGYSLKEDW